MAKKLRGSWTLTVIWSITRNQSEILRQLDASFAVSNLKGILQIEESYDKELSEVCVAMGFSAKSTKMVEKSKGGWR